MRWSHGAALCPNCLSTSTDLSFVEGYERLSFLNSIGTTTIVFAVPTVLPSRGFGPSSMVVRSRLTADESGGVVRVCMVERPDRLTISGLWLNAGVYRTRKKDNSHSLAVMLVY